MKKFLALALGILTAIGGYLDIGDLVSGSLVGARFGYSLVWVVIVGTLGICVYAEMAGRIVAMSGRPVFDLVRERLGPRAGLLNLVASFLVTGLTLTAEIGGMALGVELITGVNYLLWVPLAALVAWFVIWRIGFETIERVVALLGLALVMFVVAWFMLRPDWHQAVHDTVHPAVPQQEGRPTWLYYAVALIGASMSPYEVFFFSSGGVEEGWTAKSLPEMRANVFIGFPVGAVLFAAIIGVTATVFQPAGVQVVNLAQTALPVALAAGKVGLGLLILGIVAATFGAAVETAMSCGYMTAQYFGWQWGKSVRPVRAARFHLVVLLTMILGTGAILTTVDPVTVTEYSLVFSAVALPLTYFPLLVVANDRDYVGDRRNGLLANTLGVLFLLLLVVVAVAAIPLMLITKAGL
ncbi:MAG: NRAMP family divalent metal transporter [Mycobacteriales bacterium]